MGNLFSAASLTNWPEIIFNVDCPRQKVFENVFEPEAIRDWLFDVHEIEAVKDGDVAPGLLFQTKPEQIQYIEWTDKRVDGEGVGTHINWNFYWVEHPFAHVHDPSDPSSMPLHEWVKANADLKYSCEFFLSDAPEGVIDVGHTKVVRKTTQYSSRGGMASYWSTIPYWSTHNVMIRPDHRLMKSAAEKKWKSAPLPSELAKRTGKQWPWHSLP
jgi:hypothetical protein